MLKPISESVTCLMSAKLCFMPDVYDVVTSRSIRPIGKYSSSQYVLVVLTWSDSGVPAWLAPLVNAVELVVSGNLTSIKVFGICLGTG